jgi:hypothetical protein
MDRVANCVLLLATLVFSPVVMAADGSAPDDAARQVAAGFLKALAGKNAEDAVKVSDAPFITPEQKILTSKDAVRDYLKTMLAGASPDDLPNAILGVVPYEKSREVTDAKVLKMRDQVLKAGDRLVGIGRDKMGRGFLLVRVRGTSAAVVGIGF